MATGGDNGAPYRMSVATAIARARTLSTSTISGAAPRSTMANADADPTAPTPITPIFITPPAVVLTLTRVRVHSWRTAFTMTQRVRTAVPELSVRPRRG